jgi:hypothetical protein
MKLCPKLYLYSTILAKIVSYHFMIIYHASYLIAPFLDNLTLVIKVIRVKSSHCHGALLMTLTLSKKLKPCY